MQWDFKYTFNCKFTKESSSKKFCKSVKIWQNYGYEFVASFFGPPCRYLSILCLWCIQLLLKSEHELIETVKSTNWPNALPMAMTSMTPIIGSINAPNPTCCNSIQPLWHQICYWHQTISDYRVLSMHASTVALLANKTEATSIVIIARWPLENNLNIWWAQVWQSEI